jgi:hypothetical protein
MDRVGNLGQEWHPERGMIRGKPLKNNNAPLRKAGHVHPLLQTDHMGDPPGSNGIEMTGLGWHGTKVQPLANLFDI